MRYSKSYGCFSFRAAEIIFTLARSHASRAKTSKFGEGTLFGKLVASRRDLGLFQHHDGITGTAKDHVVIDYGEKYGHTFFLQHLVFRG